MYTRTLKVFGRIALRHFLVSGGAFFVGTVSQSADTELMRSIGDLLVGVAGLLGWPVHFFLGEQITEALLVTPGSNLAFALLAPFALNSALWAGLLTTAWRVLK